MDYYRILHPVIYNGRTTDISVRFSKDQVLYIRCLNERRKSDSLVNVKAKPTAGFLPEDPRKILDLANYWNGHQSRQATAAQRKAVAELRENGVWDYATMRTELEKLGLLIDNGYEYGTAIFKEEVPEEVVKYLFSLPGSGDSWSDISPEPVDMELFEEIVLKHT